MMERMLQKARAVLGVPVEATRADIRTAFNLMVKKHHPDSTGQAMGAVQSDAACHTLNAMRQAKDTLINNTPGAD